MKRLVLLSLLAAAVGVMAFLGCERPEPIDPTEGQPQTEAEDSLINQQTRTVEHWRIVDEDVWYFDTIESTYHRNPYTYGYLDIYLLDLSLLFV